MGWGGEKEKERDGGEREKGMRLEGGGGVFGMVSLLESRLW